MLDLNNLDTIKSVLKKNNLWPKKGFGQNFLVSRKPLEAIIKSADIKEHDTVVEIGPGLGVLTQELCKRAKLVLAIEADFKLVSYLRTYFKSAKNVKIIHQDALMYDLGQMESDYKLVSNLPYNITSPVIRKFLESQNFAELDINADQHGINKLDSMVIMVQKEVAERLTAKPGSSDRGILTAMIELFGTAEIVEIVPRSDFWPSPDVDSAILKISVVPPRFSVNQRLLMKFVKVGFSQKRRQIHHPLAANFHLPTSEIKDILESVNIDPSNRAEDLTIEQWIGLYNKITGIMSNN